MHAVQLLQHILLMLLCIHIFTSLMMIVIDYSSVGITLTYDDDRILILAQVLSLYGASATLQGWLAFIDSAFVPLAELIKHHH